MTLAFPWTTKWHFGKTDIIHVQKDATKTGLKQQYEGDFKFWVYYPFETSRLQKQSLG